METLKIPNPYDCGDDLLEFSIAYWFCDLLSSFKVRTWLYDKSSLLTSSLSTSRLKTACPIVDLKESEKDEAIAKEWLIDEAGVKPEKQANYAGG
ncbi:hypothetical protein IW262DRAFT_1466571 [Armillaria fumosa]|nr:hypothetical protein IW262DRAFT_1466571 [Armillaria fumosa]